MNCPHSTVRNNIVYNQTGDAISMDAASSLGLQVSNNYIYNEDGSTPRGTHYPYDLWGLSPAFINPAAGDYHLKSTSACINAGMTVPEITDDFDGQPRPNGGAYDIGAYEFRSQISPPTVTTSAVTAISMTGATSGGDVVSDGGAAVTERGICWRTTANPTISNSHIRASSGTGSFTVKLVGLSQRTTYHVRAYAINASGIGYGNDIPFTTSRDTTSRAVTTSSRIKKGEKIVPRTTIK